MQYHLYLNDDAGFAGHPPAEPSGPFESAEAALSAARDIVERSLREHHAHGQSAEELYRCYRAFGEFPVIVSADAGFRFFARAYARGRSREICATA